MYVSCSARNTFHKHDILGQHGDHIDGPAGPALKPLVISNACEEQLMGFAII